jgi:hypothetical protein
MHNINMMKVRYLSDLIKKLNMCSKLTTMRWVQYVISSRLYSQQTLLQVCNLFMNFLVIVFLLFLSLSLRRNVGAGYSQINLSLHQFFFMRFWQNLFLLQTCFILRIVIVYMFILYDYLFYLLLLLLVSFNFLKFCLRLCNFFLLSINYKRIRA